jgi:hypothetical protein
MNTGLISARNSVGATVATMLGVVFFFVIIGVFGLSASIAALVAFVALALFIFRRPQDGETRP